MKMNKHYNELKASYLFVDIAHKVAAYQEAHPEKEIIRLGIGDVTQPLAKCVVKAMHDAADEMGTKEGFHGYGPEQGYPFLKQAIQGYYAGRGTQLAEDEIFISDGAKSDLANVLGLFDVDNTVLVPDPVYPTYVDDNVTDGRKIIYSRTSQENGFLGMPDENVKADIIYICSPNNPTGAAYTRDQLKAWVDYARKNDAIILYDAAYECFISDENLARSIFEIEGARECAIEICSFSKIAGFTGTRCGYTVVPKELEREGMNINKLWLRRQTTKFNGVPYVVQRAAAAVFTESGMAEIQQNLDYYRKNAKVIADALDECGVWYCGGKNSPYIWLRCPGNMKSWEFFDWLLENCGVVGTPGVGFGECGEGYFRLTAFGDAEKTKMAAERIKTAIKALNDAIILYDAAYECFISDENLARSIFEIEGARECAIEICSFSKIAGFTGTRCGYTVVPKELEREGMNINKLWLRRQTTKFNGVPYVVQRAAAAVFTESGMAEIQQNLDYYRKNAKVIADALDECGVWYCGGKNSPYIWLRCPGNMKSWQFFDWLLENCGVVGTPGVGFGECGEGYFRLTAFGDAEKTKLAAERIKTAIKAL